MSPRTAWLLAIGTLAAVSCGRSHQTARDLLRHAGELRASGQSRAATIEYRNAIQKDPTLAEAHRLLADAYAEDGRFEDAYRSYTAAIDLDRTDVHSRVEAGRLLFGAGRYREALVRAEQALERDERNVDAQILAGRTLSKLRRSDEAIAQLEAAVEIDRRPSAFVALADVKQAAGDASGAEASLRAGVEASPDSPEAHIALARFLAAVPRVAEAEHEVLRAVAVAPSSEAANRAAASFYLVAHRDGEAEPFLKAAAAQQPQKLNSTLALADYYSAAHRYREARAVLAGAVNGQLAAQAKTRLAAIELETGQPEAARKILNDVMKRRPTAEMLTLDAQLLAREGKPEDAVAKAQAALDLDPGIAAAHYLIGTVDLERGLLTEAERQFQEVLRQNRLVPDATLQLARTTLAAGRADEAVEYAEAAGRSPEARLTLARALTASGQTDRARIELQRLAAEQPAAADPPVLLGALELDAGRMQAARESADRALAVAPDSPAALLLSARIAIANGDPAAAERHLTRATSLAPREFDSHALLAQLYASRGDLDGARVVLERIAARRPDLAGPRTALGIVLERSGRTDEARSRYEQALALDPREPVASNNLARLYAPDAGRVTQAVELARNAVAGLPNDADAHGTLGWIAFRAGRLSLAASELERATVLDASEPTYRTHLQEVRRAIEEEKAAARKKASPGL